MDPDFWLGRWLTNQIGFHQNEINKYLLRYWPELGLEQGSRVLVPLCGKSLDMIWLREQGHVVVGIELSRPAVEDFFRENGMTPEIREERCYTRYAHEDIEIICADFFSLTLEDLKQIDAVYDRAALIALTAAQRPRYATRLAQLSGRNTPGLLITLDYNQLEMHGPPFAVSHDEVYQLFEPYCEVDKLFHFNALDENPRFRDRGVTKLAEQVYRFRRL